MKIELLYFKGCPGFERTKTTLEEVLKSLNINEEVRYIDVNEAKKEEIRGFSGSPTILIDGTDIEKRHTTDPIMSCRVYGNKPYPDRYIIEAAIMRALMPKKILFMCVHNSARSILAEGIARHLAPKGITILSAGSNPSKVREEAIYVLKEAGISTENLYSKSVNDIDTGGVEAVITLCAEEVCPVFLGKAYRLHWGLNDPSKVEDREKRLQAFRETRDELIKRIGLLF
jgi:arsenate reductase